MISFLALAACICVSLLPLCASKDPLTWVSVEAQGAYIISDTGSGQKCGAIPNTFEMRADGTWLPSTEFDLTGNFEDDCGLHVSLSIPAQGGSPDPMSEWEDFLTQKRELRAKKKQLRAERKAYEASKKKHHDDIEESEKSKAAEIEAENKKVAAKKMEVEAMDGRVENLKKQLKLREEELEKKKNATKARKTALEVGMVALNNAKDARENEKKNTEKDLMETDEKLREKKRKQELLKKVYGNCEIPVNVEIEVLIPDTYRRENYTLLLCY